MEFLVVRMMDVINKLQGEGWKFSLRFITYMLVNICSFLKKPGYVLNIDHFLYCEWLLDDPCRLKIYNIVQKNNFWLLIQKVEIMNKMVKLYITDLWNLLRFVKSFETFEIFYVLIPCDPFCLMWLLCTGLPVVLSSLMWPQCNDPL